jgi:hypothetical protein
MSNPLLRLCPPGRSRRWIPLSLLALLLGAASATSAAVRVQVLNLSPRTAGDGGSVSFELGSQARVDALQYKGHTQLITVASPDFTLIVRDEQGAVLLSEAMHLVDHRDHVLGLIGNGRNRPLKAFSKFFHADYTPDNTFSLQMAYVASEGSFEDPVLRNNVVNPCGTALPPFPVLRNTGPRDDAFGSAVEGQFDLHTPPAGSCQRIDQYALHAIDPNRHGLVSTELTGQPGERIWAFAIGDGVVQPLESLIVRHGIEPTRPFVSADARMDGLWMDPEQPGKGIAINVDPARPDAPPTLIYYGFDASGNNAWGSVTRQNANLQLLETFVGGTESGQLPTRTDFIGNFRLRFHSCREASLLPRVSGPLTPYTAFDYLRARRLVKLLPLEDCTATSTGGAP